MIRSTQPAPRSKSITRHARHRNSHRLVDWLARPESRRIRPGRVLSAQARIVAGHYDRPEVKDYLVDALLDALSRH